VILDGVKVDVWDEKECQQIREIKHRHDRGESIYSIAVDFFRRREKTASGLRWVKKYGRKKKLNSNRVSQALKFYERMLARGERLGG